VLVDVRNVYESRIGYFSVPGIETIRPPLRQFSDFPRHAKCCSYCAFNLRFGDGIVRRRRCSRHPVMGGCSRHAGVLFSIVGGLHLRARVGLGWRGGVVAWWRGGWACVGCVGMPHRDHDSAAGHASCQTCAGEAQRAAAVLLVTVSGERMLRALVLRHG
jgi:hypothetical protein